MTFIYHTRCHNITSEDVFEYLSNDIITINAVYNVPILLVGYFNSRTGNLTDLERNFDHGGSNIEIDPFLSLSGKT